VRKPGCPDTRSLGLDFLWRDDFINGPIASQNFEDIGIGTRQTMVLHDNADVKRQGRNIYRELMRSTESSRLAVADLDKRRTFAILDPHAKPIF